ncbi:MAG: hypothetical protein A3A98_04195 [Candidatus Staskawiczbacteria bacterium RIFCSPLOWO2_01_FULL_40_39]|uniref:Uncharacterized protein n=1 Tax=Candidatus Staskawiczbacteria bacterium RIFCSPHIGHO2_01_FULL_39_25 TaxID=1802202 RepID=A0A1G2HNN7_9BACT|nr:MAG: hypothetical protein A2730_03410 [Candidatus Staskawiczbacteria bacterium RIFCSPHIGHO2_01_FULL_39_25]OGZ73969.1 MAG: hypothetical protein A3A98_04195 [Candidatus Staskawiczbacteria bacterium RIFCSPLOWO2_01_FULL_40_39]
MKFKTVISLFFRNIGIRQTVIKNAFWLVGTQVAISLLNIVLLVLAARVLGATEYGKFAYAMAFVSIIAVMIDLGVSSIMTRELAKESEREKEFSSFFSLKIILSACFFLLTFSISFFITDDIFIRKIIWILSGFVFTESFFQIIYAFFRSRQKMEYEAIFHVGQVLAIIFCGVIAIIAAPSAESLSWGYFIGSSAVLFILLCCVHFWVVPLRWSFAKQSWMVILAMSWPLTFDFVASWMYLSVDTFMIGLFSQPHQVGLFSVATKIIAVIITIAGLVSRSFYPALSKFLKESKEKFQSIWDYNMKIAIALTLPLIVGGVMFASRIINAFYGPDYIASVPVFQVLIFLAGITLLSYPYNMVLAVCGYQKHNFVIIIIGFVTNIILNLLLFSSLGIYGVALATVITSMMVLLLTVALTYRLGIVVPLDWPLLKIFLAAAISCIVVFTILAQAPLYYLSIVFLVPLGIVLYGICMFFMEYISRTFLNASIL